jgi:hypothetical protein
VALPTPPPRPRLGAEVTAQQIQEDTERGHADNPKNWISDTEHSQNSNRCCAKSGRFRPDGKSGAARTAELQPVKFNPPTVSIAAARKRVRLLAPLIGQ